MKDDNCIFCKIIAGDIPSTKLYEDENYVVMFDIGPATKGHALVIPKDHYANLFELPEDIAGGAYVLAKKMATKMKDKFQADGVNILQNNGEVAGQTVHHFHMHIIPRYKGDQGVFAYEPGSPTSEELIALKKLIEE